MIYLIVGAMGCGKSTIAKLLAERLHCRFHDAEEYFSDEECESIKKGIPLSEEKIKSWIFAVRSVVDMELAQGENFVIACSALKQRYRDTITGKRNSIRVIYLKGDRDLFISRVKGKGAPELVAAMVDRELKELEEPKDALALKAKLVPEEIVNKIMENR